MQKRWTGKAISILLAVAFAATQSGCASAPTDRQLVRKAADEYFGESSTNSIYVTGASKLCYDLESGMSAEASLEGALPVVFAFYTEIAVPILCPEYS